MNWKYNNPKFEYEDIFQDISWPWAGHKYFAYDLISNLKPKRIVELGTHYGTSLWSFSQAVKDYYLDTEINAVDTWAGEKHAGFYGEEVFQTVNDIKNKYYSNLKINLIRKTFNEALDGFEDNSIDILHIDGLHTYEAVKNDFENWIPKVKKGGILLFHDIMVSRDDFGVYKLWEELKNNYKTLEFCQSYGLGVLIKGDNYIFDKKKELELHYSYLVEDIENRKISEMVCGLRDKDNELKNKDEIINQREKQIKEIELRIKEKDGIISKNELELKNKDEIISQKDIQLNAILNSNIWKITKPMRNISDKIKRLIALIKYSLVVLKDEGVFSLIKRIARFFYKKIKNKFTFVFLIKKAFFVLKNEGVFSLFRKVYFYFNKKYLIYFSNSKKDVFNMDLINYLKINSIKTINFKKEKTPKVSIIIPVFNKWEYTYNCLSSLKENIKDITYEIIIIDDGSTDDTSEMIKKIRNIKYIKNKNNSGFVRSCNLGAKNSFGEYLVFLNNDTYVKEGWLESLIYTFKNNKNIGLIGSKLIYPNGLLQEAGGIVWSNGSGWNYGRMKDPSGPEFNYLKDVDYCSGASIMVPRNIFKELNGFDELFSPGYYEDTDFAFQVRSLGLRTVYQPLSELFHFEGITSGTDLNNGMKKFQTDNSVKFFEKWKDVLMKENMDNDVNNVFIARDRSKDKKVVLFMDNNIPTYDQDAGSYIAFQYLKILNDLNYKIIFWPHNLFKIKPYLDVLQQMGIEVVYGNKDFDSFIKDNGKFIDIAFVSRPHVAKLYLDKIKNYSNAKIVYIAHDLHFLRESREGEILGLEKSTDRTQEMKDLEFEIFKKSDVSLFFSEIEVDYIKNNISNNVSVRTIPWIQEIENKSPSVFENREGLLFMGGYNHKPNIDATIWFNKEILPKVVNKISTIKSFFYGSNPPDELRSIKSDNFILKGFLKEEDVKSVFNNAKIFIAPLRYGAGFKGKIAKAMSNGIPVVTTEIGAEGIGIVHGFNGLVSENDSNTFSDNIIKLYTDKNIWEKISNESIKHVEENFSVDNAKIAMINIINNLNI